MDISHLSEKSQELFRFYHGKAARTPGQITLLITALECLDQARECNRIIQDEGLTIASERSGLSRRHPLIDVRKESIAQAIKIFKLLGLELNQYADSNGWGSIAYE